jgi:hypothetical protein
LTLYQAQKSGYVSVLIEIVNCDLSVYGAVASEKSFEIAFVREEEVLDGWIAGIKSVAKKPLTGEVRFDGMLV